MTQWTPDDTARLALDLGRAKRRITELEAAERRIRVLCIAWADSAGALYAKAT